MLKVLGNNSYDLDLLVNASPPKLMDVATSNFAGT